MSWPVVASVLASVAAAGLLMASVVGLVWLLDRYDRSSLYLVGGVFLWGLLVAPLLDSAARTWLIGSGAEAGGAILSTLIGSICQELLKAVPLLLVAMYSRSFDNPSDGFVYGTSVGAAFAIAVVVSGHLAAAQDQATTAGSAVVDAIATVGANALAGAVLGACVGAAVLANRTTSLIAWIAGGLALATSLHAGSDLGRRWIAGASGDAAHRLVITAAQSILYVAAFASLLMTEQRILKLRLQEEVDLATVPPWVVDVIPYFRRRVRSDWWPRRSERTVLSRLLTRLAFRKHAIGGPPADERARLAGLELVQLRHRIREVLGPSPSEEDG